ncbi:MAG: porin [Planctomycetales bacterium]|nr:porin [Planctomycetales bacterium]
MRPLRLLVIVSVIVSCVNSLATVRLTHAQTSAVEAQFAAPELPTVVDPQVVPAGRREGSICLGGSSADLSGKEFPQIGVTGFFHADALYFSQDADNEALVGDATDIADFRRARLAAKGKVAENVNYMIEFDFAFPGRPSFMDVFVDIEDIVPGHLRIGQWRQPFGMDALTSVRDLTFLERALPFALAPFRQVGVGMYDTAYDERVTWAISGYRFPTDVFADVAGDAGYGTSTRETILLFHDPQSNTTLHVGGSYTYNRPANHAARIRSAPEVGFNQLDFRNTANPVPFFVDSGSLPARSYQITNIEMAGSRGAFLVQSEFYFARVEQESGPRANFHGGYAQTSYVLTGEYRAYNKAQAVFGRVIPHCNSGKSGRGAWELAGRWSYLDLTSVGIQGGVLNDVTCGLNWYLNRYTKLQFNYIHAFLERPSGANSDADIFGARAQLDF